MGPAHLQYEPGASRAHFAKVRPANATVVPANVPNSIAGEYHVSSTVITPSDWAYDGRIKVASNSGERQSQRNYDLLLELLPRMPTAQHRLTSHKSRTG